MRPLIYALVACASVATVALAGAGSGPSAAMESQLAGIRLGSRAVAVVRAYGSPRRVQVGAVSAPGQAAQGGGAMGGPGMGGPGMGPGMGGPGMGPGMMGGGPGMMGPGMRPGGAMGGPGMGPGMGGPGMGPGMGGPGMGPGMGGPGMAGGPGAGQAQPAVPQTIYWVYEQQKEGVVLIFGLDEDGQVVAISVGDGYEDSVNRGGSRHVSSNARTARGIRLGDPFRAVIKAYGYPETQQNSGDEVVLTYYDKAGVAFSMKQGVMRVTSITIREVPGTP
jgi:hypothetical protein